MMLILTLCLTISSAAIPRLDTSTNAASLSTKPNQCESLCKSNRFTTCGPMDSRFKGIFRKLSSETPPEEWVPDQSCTICPLRPAVEFKSVKIIGGQQTKVHFNNLANMNVHVFWQDFQGNPVYKATLTPYQRFGVQTWEGHAFRVWSHDYSMVLLDYTVGRYALYNENNAVSYEESAHMPDFEDPDFKRDPQPIDWEKARVLGMVNRAGVNMDLYYASHNESMIVQLRPGNHHYEITYHDHVFRARIHDNEQPLLVEFKVSDIDIPDCELRRSCGCISEAERVAVNLGNQECVNGTADSPVHIPREIIPSLFMSKFF